MLRPAVGHIPIGHACRRLSRPESEAGASPAPPHRPPRRLRGQLTGSATPGPDRRLRTRSTSLAPEGLGGPPFSTAVAGIDETGAPDLRKMTRDRLQGGLYWMAKQQRRLEAMQARWLAEFDKRQTTEGDDDAS